MYKFLPKGHKLTIKQIFQFKYNLKIQKVNFLLFNNIIINIKNITQHKLYLFISKYPNIKFSSYLEPIIFTKETNIDFLYSLFLENVIYHPYIEKSNSIFNILCYMVEHGKFKFFIETVKNNIIDVNIIGGETKVSVLHYLFLNFSNRLIDYVWYLLQNEKLDINLKCKGGMTALMIACREYNIDLLDLLLDIKINKHYNKLDILVKNDYGQSAIDYCNEFNDNFKILNMLKEHPNYYV